MSVSFAWDAASALTLRKRADRHVDSNLGAVLVAPRKADALRKGLIVKGIRAVQLKSTKEQDAAKPMDERASDSLCTDLYANCCRDVCE